MSLDDPNSPKTIAPPAVPEAATPEPPKSAPAAAPAPPPIPPQIQDFDTLINEDVRNFVELGQKINGLVGEQVGEKAHVLLSASLTISAVQGSPSSLRSRAYLPPCVHES